MSNPTTTPPTAETAPVTPVTPAIDAATIANAVAAGLEVHKRQTESAPKQMTPEEQAAYFQVFDPNADGFVDSFVAAITDPEATPESRVKVLQHFRDGVANQSIRGAQLLIDQKLAEFEQRIAPVVSSAEAARSEKLWDTFAEKYPDLKDQRDLVNAVSTQLNASGFNPSSLDEAFTRAAETARGIIAKATGKPPVSSATPTAPTTMPRMTPTNVTTASPSKPTNPAEQPGVASFFLNRRR